MLIVHEGVGKECAQMSVRLGPEGLETKCLAIIPARGGSKRIPNKNIRPFHGRPMLTYPLAAAHYSGLFDHIHVSTDNEDIAEVAARAGYPVAFMRPPQLADDETGLIPVLRNVLRTFTERGENFGVVCLILACSPLLSADDLRGAMELFKHHRGGRPVMAVSDYAVPPDWAHEMKDDGTLVPLDPQAILRNSQTFPRRYFDAGSFTFFPAHLLVSGDIYETPYIGYRIPRYRAVDIDDEEDWRLAELIYSGLSSADTKRG